MRTIILDFDYTLFDTAKFKKALAKSLRSFGINKRVWQEPYEQIRYRGGKEADYIPDRHLKILAKKTEADFLKMKKAYQKVIGHSKDFLYDDALPFLKISKKSGNVLYLLTFGDPTFQKKKIKASGISKYFQKIICTDKNKFEVSNKIPGADEAIFINDNPREILELQKIHPKAEFIQISRPKGKKYSLELKNIKRYRDLRSVLIK